MAKRRIQWNQKTIKRRIDHGFGKGTGNAYKPWLRIQDFPSKGRVHRILGMTTERVHHFFSDLEANAFHTYDFPSYVIDIREQYPLLPLEETIAIAEQCDVLHPADPFTRHPIVMTTDLYLTVWENGGKSYLGRAVKYRKELENLRSLEKLEIERRYWKVRGIDWGLVCECDIDMNFVQNVKWVRPYFRLSDLFPLTRREIQNAVALLTQRILEEELPLYELTRRCDTELRFVDGSSLAVTRNLLATKLWTVDMYKRIEPCERLELLSVDSNLTQLGVS